MRERPVMTNSCLRLLAALGALAMTCGCSELDNCDDARDPITIDRPEGTDKELLIYSSSEGWDSFDEYPAKTKLRFKHDLGVPELILPYLSFNAKAISDSNFTIGTGNAAELDCVDSHTIVLKNDTCETSFFIKVVAYAKADADMNVVKCGD